MKIEISNYIRKLIAANCTELALKEFALYADQLPNKELRTEIALHSSNYYRAKEDYTKRNTNREQYRREIIQVNRAILGLSSSIPNDIHLKINPWRKYGLDSLGFWKKHHLLIFVLFLSVIILIGVILSQKEKTGIPVEIEIVSNHISFQAGMLTNLKFDMIASQLELMSYENIIIPGKSVDLYDNQQRSLAFSGMMENGSFRIEPNGRKISKTIFASISFYSLRLYENQEVTISCSDQIGSGLSAISISASPGNISGKLAFQDSLHFRCSNSLIYSLDDGFDSLSLAYGKGNVYLDSDNAALVNYTGQKDNFVISVVPKLDKEYLLNSPDLKIRKIDFQRSAGFGLSESSIIEGKVAFLNHKRLPYDSFNIGPLDHLSLENSDVLKVKSLIVEPNRITIRFTGLIGNIFYGHENNIMNSQNPSILLWYWNTHGFIIGISSVFVILIGLLERTYSVLYD